MSPETHAVETDQAAREATGAHPYGRYLEEFEVGAVYKHWPAKTVTEADDHLFCLITMNHHPLHINDVYAGQSQQGRNVVVGPLVYSLALGMSVSDVSGKAIANLATEELKHPAPVFHGDTLFCESEVLEVKESTLQDRPRHRAGPHPGAQPGRRARRRVQAARARAAPRGRARPRRRATSSERRRERWRAEYRRKRIREKKWGPARRVAAWVAFWLAIALALGFGALGLFVAWGWGTPRLRVPLPRPPHQGHPAVRGRGKLRLRQRPLRRLRRR